MGDNGMALDWDCIFLCHLGTGPLDIAEVVQDFKQSFMSASNVQGSI